jgi:hypothetical protein
LRGRATISNCYSKQWLEQPLNNGGRRYSAWKSPDFRNVFKSRSNIFQLFDPLRSLWNFSLSEWRLPPERPFFAAQSLLCTKIPLDTPLARLATADPAIEVIERDIMFRHIWNWLNLKIAAGAVI